MHKIVINKVDYLVYRKGSGDTIEMYDIAVYSQRGVGNGAKLFNKMLAKTKEKRIFAITRKENFAARCFYEKLGFLGYELPNFYPDGDARIYIYERD